ncbi:hypothetical protein CSKR_102838 [Clonorchis sinensis]|uniref:Uncharacterized protein n=1 Tax=Clonorchis sinensis TaxID=79923 RepID=A0A419Q820_CLOSI|nr:hypothetical protein CSKR_102838 [Clonorchis sinensis]
MTSVINTDASLPYNHDLFESLIVKKRIKIDEALRILVEYGSEFLLICTGRRVFRHFGEREGLGESEPYFVF